MKRFLFVVILILVVKLLFATPVDSTPIRVVQPNGDSITIIQYGDEYGTWYETLDGYVVEKNSSNYWVYVNTNTNGNLVLTNQIVNNTSSPTGINLTNVFNTIENNRINAYRILHGDSIYYPDLEDEETVTALQQEVEYDTIRAKAPAKNKGTINILTILIQFQDVKFEQPIAVTQDYFYRLMNEENFIHPNNPNNVTGSVKKYWEDVSYGQLKINSTIIGPYTVDNNLDYYKTKWNNNNSLDASNTKYLIKEAIKEAAKNINLSIFDNDNNNYADFVHIIYAGSMESIWPHSSSIKRIYRDNVWISKYIITSEKEYNKYASIGIICHEMGHAFGAPDFYDRNKKIDGLFNGTGSWDLMANGDKNNNRNSPAHPNPYIKTEIYGWTTAKELSGKNMLDTLRPSELDKNSIYKLSTTTSGEYYLLENRQDKNLHGKGLVIYHVNSNNIGDTYDPSINIKHPQNMYVVVANNHIEKPTGEGTYGNINSAYATFKDTCTNNIFFTSQTKPSNCAWNGTPTQNKDVCFIQEIEIDGEKCIKFVLNPEIEGDSILCDSAIYSLQHVPSEATIEWTYTRPSGLLATTVPLTIGSGQGTTAVCYKRGYKLVNDDVDDPIIEPEYPFLPAPTSTRAYVQKPYSGFVTINAKVTFNGNTFTISKEIYMPEKVTINDVDLSPFGVWYVSTMKSITLKSPTNEDILENIRWDVEYPDGSTQSAYGNSVVVRPSTQGTLTVTATYIHGCDDEYKTHTKTFSIVSAFNITYTNPASGSVEINVTNGDATDESSMRTMSANNQQTPYMGAYRVELWHDVYGKVREMDVPENNPTVTMSLEGVNSGVYVMRLIIDNQVVEASQLIVK